MARRPIRAQGRRVRTPRRPSCPLLHRRMAGQFSGVVNLSVSATDSQTWLTKVEFYLDGSLVGSSSGSGILFYSAGYSNGSHTLVAKATDGVGNMSVSLRSALLSIIQTLLLSPSRSRLPAMAQWSREALRFRLQLPSTLPT